MKILLTITIMLSLSVSAFILAGCAHTPTGKVDVAATSNNLAPAIQTAAYAGTTIALSEHPEWRPGFVQANDDLKVLAIAEAPDYTTLATIVARLPVKELQGDEAKIAIEGAEILLQQFGRPDVVTSKLQDIRPIVQALQAGLEKALTPKT